MFRRQYMTSAAIAALAGSALMMSAAPSAFADAGSPSAQRAAQLVEKATGTADLAPDAPVAGSPARALTATAAGTATVTAPATSVGAVSAGLPTGGTLSLGLPGTAAVTGSRQADGTVVYPDAAKDADLAVQPTKEGGARTLVTLKDSSAPTTWRFPLALPEGAAAQLQVDGSILVSRGDEVLGSFDAPWATDAAGRPVPTSYRLEGATLVQTVEANAATAFPVVADPWWKPTSWHVPKFAKCVAKNSMGGAAAGIVGGAFAGGVGAGPGGFIGALGGAANGAVTC